MKRNLYLFILALLVTFGLSTYYPTHRTTAIAGASAAQPQSVQHVHAVKGGEPKGETSQKSMAPLFNNLGNYQHPISTRSRLAQRYFNQGLILSYGFNHAEAARSFQEAIKRDRTCAMCYWGLAYVLGPNINAPMDAAAVAEARQAVQQAIEVSRTASDREKAYIQALAKRYPETPVDDRKPFDLAYANAMREVAQRYPDDLDASTLFAEALMDTAPWDYWQENGEPKPEGVEIMQTLESILKRNPNHPGANHLYIHAVEKERPELGIPSADRLMTLVPGSGHLVHMASHIYIRVGRYHDAVVSNQRGIAADDSYAAQCHAQGIYPLAYMRHNHHFLWFAALMTGQSKIALQAARQTATMDEPMMRQPGMEASMQHFYSVPLYTLARFERWNDILSTPAPAKDLKYPNGVWHYARGLALMATGQLDRATQELAQVRSLAADSALSEQKIWGFNSTGTVLKLASEVLAGQLAAKQGDYESAIAHAKMAVSIEDALTYTEPADWYQPARQVLGSVLLQVGRAADAEQAYRDDLKIYPDNGWSLQGLVQSLKAQGKQKELQAAQTQFKTAWKYADVQL